MNCSLMAAFYIDSVIGTSASSITAKSETLPNVSAHTVDLHRPGALRNCHRDHLSASLITEPAMPPHKTWPSLT